MNEAESAYNLWLLTAGEPESAYGLWALVIVNSAVFIIFAFSFATPRSKRDWRSFGAFSAFLVASYVLIASGFILLARSWASCTRRSGAASLRRARPVHASATRSIPDSW